MPGARTSAASAGGAGGAAGVGFQNKVFGWAASFVVAEESLSVPSVSGAPTWVGAQTGSEVDDVVILSDTGNGVFIQAKINLALSESHESPLAKGLQQAVSQCLKGMVPDEVGVLRPFDCDRDSVVLCTDPAAPATVRDDLSIALSRAGSRPAGIPLDSELNKGQKRAFAVAESHIRRLWAEKTGAEPTTIQLRDFIKCLHVLSLDLDDGGKDQQAAVSVLHRGLEVSEQGPLAWKLLVEAGQGAAEGREWRNRRTLTLAMARGGVAATVSAKYKADVATIRKHSKFNLSTMQSEALLPVGDGVFIDRSVTQVLRDVNLRDPILVVGDAGSGKSGVLQNLATARQASEEVVVLMAADVAGANRLLTGAPIQEVLEGWTGSPGLVVIDGVDALRGSEDREALSRTVAALAGTRWQIAAAARSFDAMNNQPLQKAFEGHPVSSEPDQFHPRLMSVRHLLVGDLHDEDLDRSIAPPAVLATLLSDAPGDLRELLRNPFNLRLAAELAVSLTTGQRYELLRVHSRVGLLGAYWRWRIAGDGGRARQALLKRLVTEMVNKRRLQVKQAEPTILGTDGIALDEMLSQGVLTEGDSITGLDGLIGFSHNILFDYATAIYVLHDDRNPVELLKKLDADPTLALVARPSFDLLTDLLWQSDSREAFWSTALTVSGSSHVLASLAIASRLASLATHAGDLAELAGSAHDADGATTAGRHNLCRQITSAFRARAVIPSAEGVAVPLSHLARRLAENAASSFNDAWLATELIRALQNRVPIKSPNQGTAREERGQATALLLEACLANPEAREPLAGALIRQLGDLVSDSSEVRRAVRRVLDDPDALAQWGGTVTMWFPDIALEVLPTDPDLALRLAITSATFVESRTEDVRIGGSEVLPIRESRKQQSEHASYQLLNAYPEMAAIDLTTGTAIICAIVENFELMSGETNAEHSGAELEWPLATPRSTGWIGRSLGLSGSADSDDDQQEMLKILAEALVQASDEKAASALDLLVDRMHVGWAWAALMKDSSAPARLLGVLLPAFRNGTLLAHPDTSVWAAILLKAASADGGVSHHELESAVTRAIELLDDTDRGEHDKDILIGCLNSTAIADHRLVTRLNELGDSVPEIPVPGSLMAELRDMSRVDAIVESSRVPPSPEVQEAARALEAALDRVSGNSAVGVDHLAVPFAEAHTAFAASGPIDRRLEYLLLDGAVGLARHLEFTPDHEVAQSVLALLETTSDHDDVGSFSS